MSHLERKPTDAKLKSLVATIREHGEKQEWDQAWQAAQPLVEVQGEQVDAALALAGCLRAGLFGRLRGISLAALLLDAHRDSWAVLGSLGEALPALHGIDDLNGAAPAEPIFGAVVARLQELERGPHRDAAAESWVLRGLAGSCRALGRSADASAERALRRLVELSPGRWEDHYDLGLFYKMRARFAEGQAANQRASDLGGADDEAVRWNLGICATGARDTEVALRVWKQLDQQIEAGRFGLPEGGYPSAKVRLAQHPLAERRPGVDPDEPGRQEAIWIERLSPCHGVVRSALYYDEIGVDFGDVVMFDGAPITHHRYGDREVPVFPHLVTLERCGYRVFRFSGTQRQPRQIADLSTALPDETVLYSHTEQMRHVCSACANDPGTDHAHHHADDHTVVTGKLCAPPSLAARELLDALDRAVAAAPEVKLFVPGLARAAGDHERASVEERRVAMIESA